ncbi:T9SS type A sorting domain-containing protein [uncultured Hymenobacter sp.]|uniref:T9SS type A sorting domain-containing protein n=1 Tax=uncultured Hymenobacter sp. TaxID=170016 RepID=UPI0035CA28D2
MDYLRTMPCGRLWLATLLATIATLFSPLYAQTPPSLDRVEYFFDTDPGYGQATSVPLVTPVTDLTNFNLPVDAAALVDGPHRLFVRARDAAGRWSQVLNRSFTKSGCSSAPNLAANQSAASYTGNGMAPAAVEAIYNGGAVAGASSTFLDNYYAQVDLGRSLQAVSEVQLNLQNPNSTPVDYTLQVEVSGDLLTWTTADNFRATLTANQTAPVLVTRPLTTVQNNVRGVRLRLLLPTVSQGIQLTNAGVFYFNCTGPSISSFTPTSGPAGTEVTITGTNLTGATAVRFNGVTAGTITNNTGTSLTVAAPAGYSSGPICVTAPAGVACSAQSYNYPAAITTGSISPSTFCAGQNIAVPFSANTVEFGADNVFNFQLSDAEGVFDANAPLLGTLVSSNANGGTLSGIIPLTTPAGSRYRVRVVASNPAVVGTENAANLTINPAPVSQAAGPATITYGNSIDLTVSPTYPGASYTWYRAPGNPQDFLSIQQNPTIPRVTTLGVNRFIVVVRLGNCSYSSSVDVTVLPSTVPILTLAPIRGTYCAGTAYSLPFTVTEQPFPAGTVIVAELSLSSGSFARTTQIGSVVFEGMGNGLLPVTIPRFTQRFGTNYRIRLLVSSPYFLGNNYPPGVFGEFIDIMPLFSEASVSGNSPITAGDTLKLQSNGPATWTFTPVGGSPTFFSNAQNPRIPNAQPTQSGRYRATVTVLGGCTDTASVLVLVRPAVTTTSLTLDSLSTTGPACVGTAFSVSYTAAGLDFNAGNTISAVLSNANGVFSNNSPVIGSAAVTAAGAGTLRVTVPASAPTGNQYRIRLESSNPVIISNSSPNLNVVNIGTVSVFSSSPVTVGATISLSATFIGGATYQWTGPNNYSATGQQQTIRGATAANAGTYQLTVSLNGCTTTASETVVVQPPTGPIIQTGSLASSYCAGTALNVPFTASGFTEGNVFTAQLSDGNGSGSNPVIIGTLTDTTSGTIAAIIPATTTLGTGYRIWVVGSQPATFGADNGDDILITPTGVFAWTGAANSNWFDPANWNCGTVPTSTSSVLIPGGLTTYPVLGTGGVAPTALNLTLASGASLSLGSTFELLGNLVNNGILNAGSSTLLCLGTTAQTLSSIGTLRFYDLTINNPAGVTLQSPVGVRHLLVLTSGNLASERNLTLLSDATGTAMVVNPVGGGTVTGLATMQRFVTGSVQGYRHFSSPMLMGTAPVREFADDVSGFNVNPDYNTQGNAASPFPTLFQYDETRLTATNSLFDAGWMVPEDFSPLMPGRGYSVQVAPASTVDISGVLASANVSYPLTRGPYAESGWQLLGNPFPSPLDWDLVPAAPGIDKALYVYVPSGPYTGSYSSYINGVGQNGGRKDLAAMQGFFVRATSATATLSLPSSARATTYLSPTFDRSTATRTTTRPLIRLSARNARGQADETVVYFEPTATAGFDPAYDAYKVQLNGNGLPSLWTAADSKNLSINALPELATVPSIPLGVRVSQDGTHVLHAAELLNLPAGTEVWLEDRELGVRQNLMVAPSYAFTMTTSYNSQRFYLWLQAGRPAATAASALQATTHLYPNPASSTATLEMAGLTGTGDVQVQLLNTLGQVMLKRTVQPRAGTVREQLDLTHLPTGVYSVCVFTNQGTIVKRLVRE